MGSAWSPPSRLMVSSARAPRPYWKDHEMQDLNGKTAIITGGASGIGLGIARAFAREGMHVMLADVVPDRLDAARRELEALGARAATIVTDVSDPASVAAAATAVQQ